MRARLLALVKGWRETWRAMGDATKVVVMLLVGLLIAWAAFALWFGLTFRF